MFQNIQKVKKKKILQFYKDSSALCSCYYGFYGVSLNYYLSNIHQYCKRCNHIYIKSPYHLHDSYQYMCGTNFISCGWCFYHICTKNNNFSWAANINYKVILLAINLNWSSCGYMNNFNFHLLSFFLFLLMLKFIIYFLIHLTAALSVSNFSQL